MKYGSIPDSIVKGEKVARGQQIGQVGNTGNSCGAHLHYEVEKMAIKRNPADYLYIEDATGECLKIDD